MGASAVHLPRSFEEVCGEAMAIAHKYASHTSQQQPFGITPMKWALIGEGAKEKAEN